MTPQDRLIRAIKGTKRTIAETDEALTHFNDPEWPDQIRPILRVADEIRKLHEVQPDIGVADDYTNLAAVLSQIVWPEELEADDPDLSDEDYRNQDRRLTILRNWMGGLQADIGRILAAANAMGIRAFDPGLIQLVAKAGHRDDLKTIETGLTKLGQNLALLNVEDGSNDVRTRTITRYFQTWVQINIDISQLALAVGPLIDLALFKRVGSVIAERTQQFSRTITAAASRASDRIKDGAETFRKQSIKWIGAVGALVRNVRVEIGTPPPQPDLPEDYVEEAQELILEGKSVPTHWIPHLFRLDFSDEEIEDLSPLANLSALQILHIPRTNAKDLSPLANLSTLESLNLSSMQLVELTPLTGLTKLRILNLSNTQVTDLTPLANLNALQFLYLAHTKIVDISSLTNLNALRTLDLMHTTVSDLRPLTELIGLERLDLENCPVTDASPLANLTKLSTLDLKGTLICDLTPLANLTGLQSLGLSGTQVSDVSALNGLAALRHLDLRNTPVTDLSTLVSRTRLKVRVENESRAKALGLTLLEGSKIKVTIPSYMRS